MDKRGQIGIGVILLMVIGVVVGTTLLIASAQNVGLQTDLASVANKSLGVASNSTTVYLTDYRAISNVVIVNSTNGAIIPATNYTVTNNVVYNGALAVSILPKATAAYHGYVWNISGTAQPLTYNDDSASRTIAGLIIIMGALMVFVLTVPNLKEVLGFD